MLLGVFDGERRTGVGDEPDEALADREMNPTDRFGRETPRRAQRELRAVGLDQIDRADVGIESLGDPIDDVAERLGEIVRTGHDPGDVG